jgi:ABC-type proline/glycine betaine transport systems, ATPase components
VDEFVADFVAATARSRRSPSKSLADLELSPVGNADGLPRLPVNTSLRDALALLVAERRDAVLVTDAAGSPLGVATREQMIG